VWSAGGIILTGESELHGLQLVQVTLRPPQIPLLLIPKLRGKNLSHGTTQSEGRNRCTLYAVRTEVVLVIELRQYCEDQQLPCERDGEVCCCTGRHVGTECSSGTTVNLQLILRLNVRLYRHNC